MKTKLLALLAMLLPSLAKGQPVELTTQEARSLYRTTTKTRVSVHDPSVVWDAANQRYYIIGSHRGIASSKDMQNWQGTQETFARVNANGTTTSVSSNEAGLRQVFLRHRTTTVPKGGTMVSFGNYDADAWCRAIPDGQNEWNINGVMWAPDMVWNPVMQKWCQYLSLNGNAWNSVIVLLTADKLTGPWVYEGPVVYSGFRSPTDERVSWKKTDLELVIGEQTSLPSRYNHTSSSGGQTWGDWWPNNIDPCVFYDEDSKLWIAYGSWSGGIWMLELNEENGLRDYDVTYPSDYSTKGKAATSDPYFGKRIAGGCYVSGEGPYIEHIGNYYYLFMSYGGFAPDGGYEMRVFRSDKPDGPYKDQQGRSAQFTSWVLNYGGANADKRGEKIFGAYNNWGFQTVGETAQGHNSVIAAEDGRTYLVYHTKFNNGTAGHQVRVHQLFLNKLGWPVAAPFEYNGEQLTDADMAKPTPLTAADIVGTYDLMIHKYAMDHANMEEVTPVQITLNADGTISGRYTGTWSVDQGTSYVTMRISGTIYYGVIFEEVMDQRSLHAISITACNTSGVNAWAYKRHPQYALAWQVNNQTVPVYNGMPVEQNIDLSTVWQGDPNVSCVWTSSHPGIIDEYGRYNPASLAEDTNVTLTLRATSGNYFWQQDYTVLALSEQNAAPTADWLTGAVAHYGFDNADLHNTFNAAEQATLARRSTTKLPELLDDEPLRYGSYVHLHEGANGKESYVSMPNPLVGEPLADGATISFWLRRTDDNLYGALYGLANGEARLFTTGNAYTGYNDGQGTWLDINHPERQKTTELGTAKWHFVSLVFQPSATATTGGVTIYIDGTARRNDNYNGLLDGTTVSRRQQFDYSRIINHLREAPTITLGNGGFWGSPNADIDDLTIHNRPLTREEAQALAIVFNRASRPDAITDAIATPLAAPITDDNATYDMQGRRMPASSSLRPGIYVRQGKKVIVN